MTDPHIDLRTVIEQLELSLEEVKTLHATPYSDDGKNSAENRQLSTRLLFLADVLQLSSSLVRAEYWNGRQT